MSMHLPAGPTGIGLRTPHCGELLSLRPALGFVEVHSENYFSKGGQPMRILERVRDAYAVSLHGIGLSLGGAERVNRNHLRQLRALVEHIRPVLVSDHLSWGGLDGEYVNDLLPLPYTAESLDRVCDNVAAVQDHLGRAVLIENPSGYLAFRQSSMPEPEFLARLHERTGCRLLLDVNNVHVSAVNLGFDPFGYIDAIPAAAVAEIHLAGFDRKGNLLVDTHGKRVSAPVWSLYSYALSRLGDVPSLIEWDTDIPPLAELLEEAAHADHIRAAISREVRHDQAA